MEKLCNTSAMSYRCAENLVTCHEAYKIMCKMEDDSGRRRIYDDVDAPNLTPETAKHWVSKMENADGTHGPHWSIEKTEEVRKQRGIAVDEVTWWATMNMIYSDYCLAVEKLGANTAEFYICLAKAFLDDKDAQPNKLARYYEYIAKH